MLIKSKFIKGNKINSFEDLKNAEDGLWLEYKPGTNIYQHNSFVIDNPYVGKIWGDGDQKYISWLSNLFNDYIPYTRVKEERMPVFTDDLDEKLDDLFSQFAYNYSDSEFHQDEIMEKLLQDLKNILEG